MKIQIVAAVCILIIGSVQGSVYHFEQQDHNDVKTDVKGEVNNNVKNDVNKKPDFCNNLDCPSFTIVEKTDDYELRAYNATTWVTTQLAGVDYREATSDMFHKLFDYIQGQNAKKEKIAMTTPVIVRIIPGQGPTCASNFTMSFFASPTNDYPPPAPTDPTVEITKLPALMAYVRSFGGFANIDKYIEQEKELAAALPKNASYITDFYYTGGYNSPFQLFNRHNEVWLIKK